VAEHDQGGRFGTGPQDIGRQETEVFPEDTAPGRGVNRRGTVDRVTLVVGLLFTALAVLVLAGVDLSSGLFWDGGLIWVVLLGAGVALLVTELRRARRR
jgi:hypothetical protein